MRVGGDVLANLFQGMGRRDQLAGGAGCRRRRKQGDTVGGQLMRRCTSLAPDARTILTILRLVVPRTRESSISTTRLPAKNAASPVFNFTFTPKWRIDCAGSMKVRPT